MKAPMHALSVEVFANSLTSLSWILEKAADQRREPQDRAGGVSQRAPRARHAAADAPGADRVRHRQELGGAPRRQEPLRFEDNETTIEELRARVARCIDYMRGLPAGAFEGAETRDIKVPTRDRTLEFKGLEFLQRWAIPNVLFHVTTAYNILRHNGVDLGKRDFLHAGREM